jgi:hypothetical protein
MKRQHNGDDTWFFCSWECMEDFSKEKVRGRNASVTEVSGNQSLGSARNRFFTPSVGVA